MNSPAAHYEEFYVPYELTAAQMQRLWEYLQVQYGGFEKEWPPHWAKDLVIYRTS